MYDLAKKACICAVVLGGALVVFNEIGHVVKTNQILRVEEQEGKGAAEQYAEQIVRNNEGFRGIAYYGIKRAGTRYLEGETSHDSF